MNKPYDLSESLEESFTFKLRGFTYRFRYMSGEEIEKYRELTKDKDQNDQTVLEYFYSFVTKVDENAPEFKDMQKKMIIPELRRFRQMIETEFEI